MTKRNRERVPERQPHAKGSGGVVILQENRGVRAYRERVLVAFNRNAGVRPRRFGWRSGHGASPSLLC